MSNKWVAKKMTINMSEQTVVALEYITKITGKNATSAINDAIQALALSLGWDRST